MTDYIRTLFAIALTASTAGCAMFDKKCSHEVTLSEVGGFELANPSDQVTGLFSPQL